MNLKPLACFTSASFSVQCPNCEEGRVQVPVIVELKPNGRVIWPKSVQIKDDDVCRECRRLAINQAQRDDRRRRKLQDGTAKLVGD